MDITEWGEKRHRSNILAWAECRGWRAEMATGKVKVHFSPSARGDGKEMFERQSV